LYITISAQKEIAFFGIFNSLSQVLLKITSPGIPDFYQGSELWDFNFVDPDNRKEVNFEIREKLLESIKEQEARLPELAKAVLTHPEDGQIKLFTIYIGMKTRKSMKTLFEQGAYLPLEVQGTHKDRVIAFARVHNNACCITIVPRFLTKLVNQGQLPLGKEIWADTTILLPDNLNFEWTNAFTNQTHPSASSLFVGEVLSIFPICLLVGKSTKSI
jgi:(1->4)-alpha-D-glucan 1-alpha-D-glucosylmutase